VRITPATPDPQATHGPFSEVAYEFEGTSHVARTTWVLANVTPWVLAELLGETPEPALRPQGAQVKVNLLLSRLPQLADTSVTAEQAFGGTFHINELYSQLDTSYLHAASGKIPSPLPCEIYCHSLSDPSILSPELRATGAQTLTVFGLHVPHSLLTRENNDAMREQLQAAVLASLNSVLAEPIEGIVLTDANGNPCIETKTTLDLEDALGMTGGNIFHGLLSWPFVEDDADLSTPAARWGVATKNPSILLCGSGAQRGGAVSGIGGHNAAMAVMEG
jgi:phytoene dehydrogenase-like protein